MSGEYQEMIRSELERQLLLLKYLAEVEGAGAADLGEYLGVSEPTVKRDVAFCRHLGADIVADRALGYRLMNWPKIRRIVERWYDLEVQRSQRLEEGFFA